MRDRCVERLDHLPGEVPAGVVGDGDLSARPVAARSTHEGKGWSILKMHASHLTLSDKFRNFRRSSGASSTVEDEEEKNNIGGDPKIGRRILSEATRRRPDEVEKTLCKISISKIIFVREIPT